MSIDIIPTGPAHGHTDKVYLKQRCPKEVDPFDGGWIIVAMDDESVCETIAHIETESLADIMMRALTNHPGPFTAEEFYHIV